jgi:hypothetical protein
VKSAARRGRGRLGVRGARRARLAHVGPCKCIASAALKVGGAAVTVACPVLESALCSRASKSPACYTCGRSPSGRRGDCPSTARSSRRSAILARATDARGRPASATHRARAPCAPSRALAPSVIPIAGRQTSLTLTRLPSASSLSRHPSPLSRGLYGAIGPPASCSVCGGSYCTGASSRHKGDSLPTWDVRRPWQNGTRSSSSSSLPPSCSPPVHPSLSLVSQRRPQQQSHHSETRVEKLILPRHYGFRTCEAARHRRESERERVSVCNSQPWHRTPAQRQILTCGTAS